MSIIKTTVRNISSYTISKTACTVAMQLLTHHIDIIIMFQCEIDAIISLSVSQSCKVYNLNLIPHCLPCLYIPILSETHDLNVYSNLTHCVPITLLIQSSPV